MRNRIEMLCSSAILIGILHCAFSETTQWPATVLHQSTDGDNKNNEKLLVDGDSIYVGSSNVIYKIDYSGTKIATRYEVPVSSQPLQRCLQYSSFPDTECVNNIRLLLKYDEDKVLACGTYSSSPKCMVLDTKNESSIVDSDLSVDLSNFPAKAVTLVDNGKTYLYSASTSKGDDGKLWKSGGSHTIKSSKDWFKDPRMVDMFVSNDKTKVFTFHNDKIDVLGKCNSGYDSFVSRVCTKDSNNRFPEQWTTHAKAHLNCFDDKTLQYKELSAVQVMANGRVYGLFNVPSEWNVKSSALCAYDINSINDVFDGKSDGGQTKFRKVSATGEISETTYSEATPMYPGQCPNGTLNQVLSDYFYSFVSKYPVVYEEINPITQKPLFVQKQGKKFDFSLALETETADILYLFSDDGWLNKLRVARANNEVKLLNEINIFNDKVVKSKKIVSVSFQANKKGIVVVTPDDVLLVKTSSCAFYTDCASCLIDPHCHWQSKDGMEYSCSEENGTYSSQTCGIAPTPPTKVNAFYNENDFTLQITWDNPISACSTSHCDAIVKLTEALTSNVAQSTKTNQSNIILENVKLQPGSNYEITVVNIEDGIQSESVVYEMPTDIQPVHISYDSNQMFVEWSPIRGATHYIVKFYDQYGVVIFEGKIAVQQALQEQNSYRLPFPIDVSRYNISVSAVSSEDMHSKEMFISNFDRKVTPQPVKDVKCESTSPIIAGVAVLVVLLVITWLVILFHLCTLPPKNTTLLSKDKNVIYCRKYLFFWSETKEMEKGQTRNEQVTSFPLLHSESLEQNERESAKL